MRPFLTEIPVHVIDETTQRTTKVLGVLAVFRCPEAGCDAVHLQITLGDTCLSMAARPEGAQDLAAALLNPPLVGPGTAVDVPPTREDLH